MDPTDFDDPHPGTEDIDLGGESPVAQAAGLLEPIKPYAQHIIAVVAILAIAWFAYDFLFASLLEVQVTVKDTEGNLIRNNEIELFAQGSTQPFFSEKNKSSYTVSLKPGRYNFELKADGYDAKTGGFDVSEEEKMHVIVIEQDLGVEIAGFEESLPGRMFAGGVAGLSIQLKNDSSKAREVELVAEGDIEGMIPARKVTVPKEASEIVELQLSIPSDEPVEDERNGDQKEAVLRIKYTDEKESAGFTLFPNPAKNISLDSTSLEASARENENKDEDEITIENDNDFAVENLVLSIEITSAPKNGREEVKSWLQFSEVANEEEPQQIEITSIGGGDSVTKELQLVVPLTAKKEIGIKGNLVLEAAWLSEPIKKTLTIEVEEEAEFGLALSTEPESQVEIEWDDTWGKYKEVPVSIQVKNEGQIDLRNLVFSIENDTECSTDWLEFQENSIEVLQVGRTEELKLIASAPIAVRGQETSSYCNIRYRYDDPVKLGQYIEETEISLLEIMPEES